MLRELTEPGGVLDALLGRLAADWRRFRWNPDPARLPPLEEDVDELRARLAAARARLTGEPDSGRGADRPPPRPEADPATVARVTALEEELRRLLRRAAGLGAARPSPPERPEAGAGGGDRIGSGRPAADRSAEGVDDETGRRIRNVDAHLAAVARLWKSCRRRPRAEEVGLLRSRLRDTLLELASLRAFLEESEPVPGPGRPPLSRDAGAAMRPSRAPARPATETRREPNADAGPEAPGRQARGPEAATVERTAGSAAGAAPAGAPGAGESGAGSVPETPAPEVRFPYRDPVTGSFSREGFDVLVRGEIKRCRRYERALSLLLVEVDGDGPWLRGATDALRTALRGSDLVARHAERTVAVALPETTAEDARTVADRVLRTLDAANGGSGPFRMGLSTYPLDGETLSTLSEVAWLRLVSRTVGLVEPGGNAGI